MVGFQYPKVRLKGEGTPPLEVELEKFQYPKVRLKVTGSSDHATVASQISIPEGAIKSRLISTLPPIPNDFNTRRCD